jgi:hypothetical protein
LSDDPGPSHERPKFQAARQGVVAIGAIVKID